MSNRVLAAVVCLTIVDGLMRSCTASPARAATAGPKSAAALCAVLPRPTLRVRLVVESGVPEGLRSVVESTVATIWRREGMVVEWQPPSSPDSTDRSTQFWLRLTSRYLGRLRGDTEQTLGVVRFFDDLPHHDVLVSWPAAREWARRERARVHRSTFLGVPRVMSLEFGGFEDLARRAVVYAAAHEVGHFVLGMKSHDRSGLMRPDFVARVVTAVEGRDLHLADRSRERLRHRLAQGAACTQAAQGGR